LITRLEFDGVTFDVATDFTALARKALLWQLGGSLPTDLDPLDWVERAYESLEGTPFRDRFSIGVADCLSDTDAFVRYQALLFFAQFPFDAGAERILDLAAGDRAGFRGVPRPSGSADLEWSLLNAVASRIAKNDPRAIAIGKKEALSQGQSEALMAALTIAVPEWVVEHAEDIVRLRPQAGFPMLYNLDGKRFDVAAFGIRIARYAALDPGFREYVERLIDDVEIKRRILSAIPSL